MKRLAILPIALLCLRCGVQPKDALIGDVPTQSLRASGIEKILYVGQDQHFYVLDGGSSGARRITATPAKRIGVWSPDGGRIAYRELDANNAQGSLWVMRADGAEARQLVSLPGGPAIYALRWSPDGSEIAFRVGAPTWAVQIVRADGTGLRQVEAIGASTSPDQLLGFAWSPDGRALAFEAKLGDDAGMQVYLVNEDGTATRRLTGGRNPSWSPDGKRVLFISGDHISTIDADGKNPQVVSGEQVLDAVWSPQGDVIAYRPILGGGMGVVRPDGSGQRTIVGTGFQDAYLMAWSSDGTRIAFLGLLGSQTSVFAVQSSGANLSRLVDGVGWYDVRWSR